jgi:general secretion pathway protein K
MPGTARNPERGIALIIVMLVIVVLSILAAGFAYSMKVETKLARNANNEAEMFTLAWSGVELARYTLAQKLNDPEQRNFDALNQRWAGGPGGTNDPLAEIPLANVELGRGRITVQIEDRERQINLNLANREMLERALRLIGVESLEISTVVDSIEDWRDPNQNPQINGAESDYYLSLSPPYEAKDGPLDSLSELLMIRGVTPEMYWGPLRLERYAGAPEALRPVMQNSTGGRLYAVGLVDLFNTSGRLQVNVNTASAAVLQLLPGLDEGLAHDIVQHRAGFDGVEGTEDDLPFHTPGELINVPGMQPQFVQALQRTCAVVSFTFEVRVVVDLDQYQRTFVALLSRAPGRTPFPVLNAYWE